MLMVALVFAGVTINVSCKEQKAAESADPETAITQRSENLTIISSSNGKLSYRFETPLMENYELATEPYMEFRQGIKVTTYNDSTRMVESELTADYAKRIDQLKLWEARGNVVGTNRKGERLETEQLFWDEGSDKVYSNVYSKITRNNDEVLEGSSFESNTELTDFLFRNPVGYVMVDPDSAKGGSPADSTATSIPDAGLEPLGDSPEVPDPVDPSVDLSDDPSVDPSVPI